MSNTIIQIKNSGVAGNVPATLQPGELAINYFDGQLFYGNSTSQSVPYATVTEPAGLNGELQFNDSGSFGSDATLSFNKSTGVFTAPIVASSNNGTGQNFKVGDDAWIGDVNLADTLRISGQQNVNNAYIVFGASNANTLGRSGTGPLTYTGDFKATGLVSGNELTSTNSNGPEGGQVNLAIPASGTSLAGSVTIDVYGNQLRFFQGDSAKGAYIDLTSAASGVGTNLLNTTAGSYANSAYLHANSAYAYANALSGGTATDGVARSIANSAYVQANASFQNSNSALSSATSAGSYANSAYGQANTATTNAATADQRAVTSGVFANAAFLQANTATTNAATADQRAVTSGSYANSAYVQANTGTQYAQAAGSYANSAYTQANTATTNAATADQRAVTSGSYANSAYGQANTADQKAVTSGDYANSAFVQSNTGIILAQAAYDAANTLSGGTALDGWARQAANSASSYANSAYIQANTADQKATTSGDYANSAFLVANTALSSIPSLSGYATEIFVNTAISNLVDSSPTTLDTLNELAAALGDDANFATTITNMVGISGGYANSAYLQANAAFEAANNATDNWVRIAANSASSYANSSFLQANTGTILAQAAFDKANTGITDATDQVARNTANASYSQANTATTNAVTADQKAVSAGSYANSAYDQANTATTNAATADQRAVTSGLYANSAYGQANTSDQRAVTSGSYANSAYSLANTTALLAQAAFDKANTGTSSSTDTFARTQANSAYNQANTGTLLAQSAYDFANTLSISGGSSIGISNDVSTNSEFYVTFTDSTSGIVTSLNTSDTKLGYNPSTGTLKVQAVDVTANATISSNTVEDTTGTQFTVDSFSVDEIRSAFYQVQIESSVGHQILNLNVVHDGSTANVSTFGNTLTSSSLGTFTASIVGGILRVLFTPTVSDAVVSFIKNAIRKIAQLFPTGDLGFVGDNATAFYDLGYVADGQTSSVDYGGLD